MSADQGLSPRDDRQGAWARPVPARLGEAGVGLALLASGVFFAWQSLGIDFGRVGLPGPGFFPFALGVVLSVLALALLYRVWRDASDAAVVFLGHRDVVIAMAAMAGLALVFERIDSYLALGAFTAVLLLFVARAAPWRVLLGTTLGMVAVWLFFGLALGVRLPTGDFWDFAAWLASSRP